MKNNVFNAVLKNEMVSRTFHLQQDQLKPLQETAKELGVSQSEIVRRSISLFIDEFHKRSGPVADRPD